jgi:hypothetical protein
LKKFVINRQIQSWVEVPSLLVYSGPADRALSTRRGFQLISEEALPFCINVRSWRKQTVVSSFSLARSEWPVWVAPALQSIFWRVAVCAFGQNGLVLSCLCFGIASTGLMDLIRDEVRSSTISAYQSVTQARAIWCTNTLTSGC